MSDEYGEDGEGGEESEREWLDPEQIEKGYVAPAKEEILKLFHDKPSDVFYERQLQVLFEKRFYHWITSRALSELANDRALQSDYVAFRGSEAGEDGLRLRFFFLPKVRYWKRQAGRIVALVNRYSDTSFNAAVGHQAEMLFDAALALAGFMPTAHESREFGDRRWTDSNHDLDRIYVRDGIAYGAEIKNKLGYIDRDELIIKLKMCRHLRLRPLFIARWLPKAWVWEVSRDWGGFCLLFKYQLYPFGSDRFAKEIRDVLGLPVDCPKKIQEGTIKRFLNWHVRNLV